MKTLIDRANSLYAAKRSFSEIYVITSSADDSKGVSQCVLNGIKGWISCFDGVELKGWLEAGGVNLPGEISNRKDILEAAYNMGKNI